MDVVYRRGNVGATSSARSRLEGAALMVALRDNGFERANRAAPAVSMGPSYDR